MTHPRLAEAACAPARPPLDPTTVLEPTYSPAVLGAPVLDAALSKRFGINVYVDPTMDSGAIHLVPGDGPRVFLNASQRAAFTAAD